MRKECLFIAPYYNSENIKEGMIQRIKAVDDNFVECNRIYLNLRFHKFFIKKIVFESEAVRCYNLNIFIHFFFILRLIRRCPIVYFHSIYNVFNIFPLFLFSRGKTILDLHGVVPEELMYTGHRVKFVIYSFIEKMAFKKMSLMIFVTESMAEYYKTKYPNWRGDYKIYYIIPSNLVITDTLLSDDSSGQINVLFSGNTQQWQNIDLMLDVIKQNLSPKINYLILTGEPDIFREKLKEHGIHDKIEIKSVHPSELGVYYKKAHYGFILRDDIVVNRVANPTKLIEYLSYGMIPIVKSAQIGDFLKLNYEYLHYLDFSDELLPAKSNINLNIAKGIIGNYSSKLVFNDIISDMLQ